ncbi:MAG: hypothetical protein EA383_16855 [Spirochaetaceae bacterium]|nr:MAG: hypothetical protein EA383_16855 [Spirochaetaceae bacterium]
MNGITRRHALIIVFAFLCTVLTAATPSDEGAAARLSLTLRTDAPHRQDRRVVYTDDRLRILYTDTVRDGILQNYTAGFAVPVLHAGPLQYSGLDRDLHTAPPLSMSLDSLFGAGGVALNTDPPQNGPRGMVGSSAGTEFSVLRLDSEWTRVAVALHIPVEPSTETDLRIVFMRTQLEAVETPTSWRLPETYREDRRLHHLGVEFRHAALRYRLIVPYGDSVRPAVRMQMGFRRTGRSWDAGFGGLLQTPGYTDAQGRRPNEEASGLVQLGVGIVPAVRLSFTGLAALLHADDLPRAYRETDTRGSVRLSIDRGPLDIRISADLRRRTDHYANARLDTTLGARLRYSLKQLQVEGSAERTDSHVDADARLEYALASLRLSTQASWRFEAEAVSVRTRHALEHRRGYSVLRVEAHMDGDDQLPIVLRWTYAGPLPSRQ